jgi:hypothetical protein
MSIIILVAILCIPSQKLEKKAINSFSRQMSGDLRFVRRENILSVDTYIKISGNNDGYELIKVGEFSKNRILPKGGRIEFVSSSQKISFTSAGSPLHGGGTIKIKLGELTREITIVPTSGRILLKE